MELLTASGLRRANLKKITLHYITHIDDFGKLALRMDEDEAVRESIHSMAEIGICAVSDDLETSVEDILQRLLEFYEILQLKKFEILKLSVTKAISRIGSAAAAQGQESASLRSGNILNQIHNSVNILEFGFEIDQPANGFIIFFIDFFNTCCHFLEGIESFVGTSFGTAGNRNHLLSTFGNLI